MAGLIMAGLMAVLGVAIFGGFISWLIVIAYSSTVAVPHMVLVTLCALLTIGAAYICIRGFVVIFGGWLPQVKFFKNTLLRISTLLLAGFVIGMTAPMWCCGVWLAGGIIGTITNAFS